MKYSAVLLVLLLFKQSETFNFLSHLNGPLAPTTVLALGPNQARAEKYSFTNGASFCPPNQLQDWSCSTCLQAKSLGLLYAGHIENIVANTFAFFAVDTKDREILLAFRGSFNLQNIGQDLLLKPLHDVGVHGGFILTTNSLYSKALERLCELFVQYPGYTVLVAGHSLGAAIATLTTYMMINRVGIPACWPPARIKLALLPYGSPRVGGKAFVDFLNGQADLEITRVVSKRDIVPHLPSVHLGYLHVANELWLKDGRGIVIVCSKSTYEDPTCSYSVPKLFRSAGDHMDYYGVKTMSCFNENPVWGLSGWLFKMGGNEEREKDSKLLSFKLGEQKGSGVGKRIKWKLG